MGRLIPRSSAAVQNFTSYAPVKNVLKPHSGNNFFFYLFFLQRSALVSRSAVNNTRKTWCLILSIQVGFMFRIHCCPAQCPKLLARLTPSQKAAQCITWANFVQSSDSLKKFVFQLFLEDIVQI